MKWELVIYVLAAGVAFGQSDFNPKQVVQPFDPIVEPKAVAANKAGDLARADELVLGVVVNKEARAYPINQLTRPTREIINDKLGGRAIAATW